MAVDAASRVMPTFQITSPYNAIKALLYKALTLAAATTTLVVNAAPASSSEAPFNANWFYVTTTATFNTIKLPSVADIKAAGADTLSQTGEVEVVFSNAAASLGPLYIQNSGATQIAALAPGQSCRVQISGTQVVVVSGGPTDGMLQAVPAVNNTTPSSEFVLPLTIPAGAGNTDFANVIPRACEVMDTTGFVSGGATGGTVQLQTSGGALNITDAMVPGNADIITRPTTVANRSLAAGAGLRVVRGAGNPGGTLFLRLLPR